MVKTIVMSLSKRDASGFKRSCNCTSCFLKSASECSLEQIVCGRSYMNRFYYGTHLPLQAKKINELIKVIIGCDASQTIPKSNTSLQVEVPETRNLNKKRQFIDTYSELDHFVEKYWYSKFDNYNANKYANNSNNVSNCCTEIYLYPRESAEADLNYASKERAETAQNTCNARSQRIVCVQSNKCQRKYKTKSDPCTSLTIRNIGKLRPGSRQHKLNKKMDETSTGLANTYLQTIHCPTSSSLYEIRQRKLTNQTSDFGSFRSCYSNGYTGANFTPECLFKETLCNVHNIHNLSETSILVTLSNRNLSKASARSWNSFYSFSGSFLLQSHSTNTLESNTSCTVLLVPSSITQLPDDQALQLKRELRSLKLAIGPYAQMQVVYNVMEQASSSMKEKGTSQQFKQRSQAIGTSSIENSSNGTPKRRAVKIESNVSFSIEFFKKDKSSGVSSSGVSDQEAAPQKPQKETPKPKADKKKSLHRCFCTMSFPTEGRKPEECASGVCVPGECDAKECFKRIEKKYGAKKKKSGSEASSSQVSQTKKTKGKEERAGKEIKVKEKGSSSISKYTESVKVKEPPPEKEQEKFSLATCTTYLTNCCNKIKFWEKGGKDKAIELKRTTTDTDIAGKTAGTPSTGDGDKKTPKKAKTKEPEAKKTADKKSKKSEKDKPVEAATKATQGKVSKKEPKAEKKETKEKEKKEVKEKEKKGKKEAKEKEKTGKKEEKEKKGKKEDKTGKKEEKEKKGKKEDKEKEKAGKKEDKLKEKKGKKDDKEKEKKGKKDEKEKEKKEKKGKDKKPKKEKKKGPPLKPYECEPGVCKPKVCSPQECYNRKFPPPPKKEVAVQKKMGKLEYFFNIVRQFCCRPTLADDKKGDDKKGDDKKAVVSADAATQSRRKLGGPVISGAPAYKEKGSAGVPTGKAMGRRGDTGLSQYTDGGDYGGPADSTGFRSQRGVQYFQSVDSELNTQRQGVNIGSECSCSVEFYKLSY